MKNLRFLLLTLFTGLFLSAGAQVTSVNYQMKYDTSTCLYDCYIIINSGQAQTVQQRIQFNSQYSIVVPFGTTVSVDTTYNPLIGNQSGNSTTPQVWSIGTSQDYPASSPTQTFYSIVPDIVPQAHYDTLFSGDTVKLFSLSLSPTINCASDIRIFENGSDPSSSDPDMAGLDFSNGFTMGSIAQLYTANSSQVYPPTPIIVSAVTGCSTGIEIDLSAYTSGCQAPLSYQWTGPNSFSSTSEDVNIFPATPADNGYYKVVLTDGFGCMDSITVEATSKPDAGSDLTVCAGTSDTLHAVLPLSGTWSAAPGNPGGASIINVGSGQALYTLTNAALGDYNFIYSVPGCSDTMMLTVDPKPVVSISGDTEICVGATSQLSPNSGGVWASNNPSVATVDPSGLVTAVSSGTTTFTFTADLSGCQATTGPITINNGPTVTVSGQDSICIGTTTNVTPSTGGTWSSSDITIATVTNSGLVTGISAGTALLTFNETATGCDSEPISIEIEPSPIAEILGNDTICVFTTTQLGPSTGGTWTSSNNLIATINNSGIVTGLQPGKVVFTYTQTSTQCVSEPSDTITVAPDPVVGYNGSNQVCVGSTTQLFPATGGTWTSNNTNKATVTNAGVVTTLQQGSVTFTFVDSATGCDATTTALVIDPVPTAFADQNAICIGASTNLHPSTGGSWTNHSPTVASLTFGNKVTGLAAGDARFTFVETGTGCQSDTVDITVEPGPVVGISGDDEICVGFTTQLSPSTGGTWTSSDNNIATVSNSGLVTGVNAGVANFTFTSSTTFCVSEPTDPVTVLPRPIINLQDSEVCVNETTNITPSSGGTWSVANGTIASITNAGLITGLAAGTTNFTFTDTVTSCISLPSAPITVNAIPTASFTGPAVICEGTTTTVSPSFGGTWVSNNTAVAQVTNTGVVTAIGAGTATLTYTETSTTCSAPTLTITVEAASDVDITGDTTICIGSTTTLSPTTGGTWMSSNSGIATVANNGTVTGVAQGTATFTFLNSAGCTSEATEPITVEGAPVITITGDDQLCIGDTTFLSPASTGIWTADDPTLVNILPNGVIIAVSEGVVTFSFQDTITGCASEENSDPITINPTPTTNLNGPDNICVGSTSSITPSVNGSWSSSDPSVASISNSGLITGVGPGTATFTYTNSATGCVSDASDTLTVTSGPIITLTGLDELCIGETTTFTPTSGGTWTSSDEDVATITNAGVVTAVGAGSATFVFEENGTGCLSEDSDPVIVHPKPNVFIDGSDIICKGGTTNLLPNTGGTWESSDTLIATVTSTGLVTGITEGTVTFTFTLDATGCPSDATDPVTVSPAPNAEITGPTEICIGSTTTLSPATGGVWVSSNPSVATVTNTGIVTAHAPGKATFSFTETATGCSSESSTGELNISNCLNPDFNSTFVDVPVNGDANTNDFVGGGTTYGPSPVLNSSPSGSIGTLVFNSDGTYTFSGNMVGVYVYAVPVCVPPQITGCQTSLLTITVVDYLSPDPQPVANTDYGVTDVGVDVTLESLANDKCVMVTGCSIDTSSVTIISSPGNGTVSNIAANGDITYSPNPGFVGKDTLTYQVCIDGDLSNCATAIQIITINDISADNSTYAADDYNVTAEITPVSGNVSLNDTDAEGDVQTVDSFTMTVPAGTLILESNGDYTFTPAEDFYGPVDFVYTTCDDNVVQACTDATLHILVVPDLSLKIRVYLEGPFLANGNAKGTTHNRPLMRDNLRNSPFNGVNYIPVQDPYQVNIIDEGLAYPYDTYLNSLYTHTTPGDNTEFLSIPNPSTVFAVTGEDAIVDWVFVELRSKADSTVVLATRSALLQRDGDVTDLDGNRGLRIPGMKMDDYYVVVKHRNHLGAMTKFAQTPAQLTTLVDFTVTSTPVFDYGLVDYGAGVTFDFTGLALKEAAKETFRALWAGDFDGNDKIKAANPGDDLNVVFSDVFIHPNNTTFKANFDFAYGYRSADFDLNAKVKFDNPNDDKNMLFGQLLFYPLNDQFLSNFDFFIEQLPE